MNKQIGRLLTLAVLSVLWAGNPGCSKPERGIIREEMTRLEVRIVPREKPNRYALIIAGKRYTKPKKALKKLEEQLPGAKEVVVIVPPTDPTGNVQGLTDLIAEICGAYNKPMSFRKTPPKTKPTPDPDKPKPEK